MIDVPQALQKESWIDCGLKENAKENGMYFSHANTTKRKNNQIKTKQKWPKGDVTWNDDLLSVDEATGTSVLRRTVSSVTLDIL